MHYSVLYLTEELHTSKDIKNQYLKICTVKTRPYGDLINSLRKTFIKTFHCIHESLLSKDVNSPSFLLIIIYYD